MKEMLAKSQAKDTAAVKAFYHPQAAYISPGMAAPAVGVDGTVNFLFVSFYKFVNTVKL